MPNKSDIHLKILALVHNLMNQCNQEGRSLINEKKDNDPESKCERIKACDFYKGRHFDFTGSDRDLKKVCRRRRQQRVNVKL